MVSQINIYTWINVADIHLLSSKKGDYFDQERVAAKLLSDIEEIVISEKLDFDSIMVIGDLTFDGSGSDNKLQFSRAKKWLGELINISNIDPQDVFIVPGNHDYQREIFNNNKNLKRLITSLSSGDDELNEVLNNSEDSKLLQTPYVNYVEFANGHGRVAKLFEHDTHWYREIESKFGIKLMLHGLNSSIMTFGDSNDNLLIGKTQIRNLTKGNGFNIALSHFPLEQMDSKEGVKNIISIDSDIFICGHTHRQLTSQQKEGGGRRCLNYFVGATYSSESKNFSYSICSILYDTINKQYLLRCWPRKWSEQNLEFRVDIDNTTKGSVFTEYKLRNIEPPITPHVKLEVETVCLVDLIDKEPLSKKSKLSNDYRYSEPPPIPASWVGRVDEIEFVGDGQFTVVAITGIGGQGKSALASKYIDNLTKLEIQWDWRDCREEGDTFITHLINILVRLSKGSVSGSDLNAFDAADIVDYFFKVLGEQDWVFVFDNVDHYVDINNEQFVHIIDLFVRNALEKRINSSVPCG